MCVFKSSSKRDKESRHIELTVVNQEENNTTTTSSHGKFPNGGEVNFLHEARSKEGVVCVFKGEKEKVVGRTDTRCVLKSSIELRLGHTAGERHTGPREITTPQEEGPPTGATSWRCEEGGGRRPPQRAVA